MCPMAVTYMFPGHPVSSFYSCCSWHVQVATGRSLHVWQHRRSYVQHMKKSAVLPSDFKQHVHAVTPGDEAQRQQL